MKVNQQIKDKLEEFDISEDDGVPYLTALHFGYSPSYIPEGLVARINRTNIITRDRQGGVKWTYPLFENQVEVSGKFEWVTEWVEMFENVNPKRKGSIKTATTRMKQFFAENPEVRKQDVIDATQMYIRSLNNPEYITTSHYFIYKGVGKTQVSLLEEWVEKLETAKRSLEARRSTSNTMR